MNFKICRKFFISSVAILLLVISLIPQAGYSKAKIKKALKALEEFNFGKALFYVSKYEDKGIIDVDYVFALIYKQKDLPYYNLKKSYSLINNIISKFDSLPKKEKYLSLNITTEKLLEVRKDVEDEAFKLANDTGTVNSLTNFISFYTHSEKLSIAINERNRKEFDIALADGSSEGLKNFISKYPDFEDIEIAKKLAQDLEFYEQTSEGDVSSYFSFVENHPDNYNIEKAINDLYQKLKLEKNINYWEKFLVSIPQDNKNYDNAWFELYKAYTIDSKVETFENFKYLYLGFPHQKQLDEDIERVSQNFVPIRENEKWGFLSTNKKFKIEARYDWVERFLHNVFAGGIDNEIHFVSKAGRSIFTTEEYDNIEKYDDDLFLASRGDSVGLVDHIGNNILEPVYDEIFKPSENRVGFCLAGKCGFFNECFDVIIPPMYEDVWKFDKKLAVVSNEEDQRGLINFAGDTVLDLQYEWIEAIGYNIFKVKEDSYFSLYKAENDSLFKISNKRYDYVQDFSEGMALVATGEKMGYIDSTGKEKIPLKYSFKPSNLLSEKFNYDFHQGIAKVFKKTGYGYIDKNEKVVIPFEYENGTVCSDSIVGLRKKQKWFFYDRTNNSKIHSAFTSLAPFNLYGIGKEGKILKVINRGGVLLVEEVWEEAVLIQKKYLQVKKYNKYGITDIEGNYILPLIFDEISVFVDDVLLIQKSQKMAYYSLNNLGFIFREEGF